MRDAATIRAEIAALEAENAAAPGWGAAVGARLERIRGLETELHRAEIAAGIRQPLPRYGITGRVFPIGPGTPAVTLPDLTHPAHQLLTRAHAEVARALRVDVECTAIMVSDGSGPLAGSIDPHEAEGIDLREVAQLLRDIEAVTGPLPLPVPWLRAVIDAPETLIAPADSPEEAPR